MFRLISPVPRRHTQSKTSFPFFDLSEPGHISSCGSKKSVKHDGPQLRLPGIGNQKTLLAVQQCIPVFPLLFKRHGARPVYPLYFQSFFADRDPFKIDVFRCIFDPHIGLELIGNLFPLHQKSLVSASDPRSDSTFYPLMCDSGCIRKFQTPVFILQIGSIGFFPFPLGFLLI